MRMLILAAAALLLSACGAGLIDTHSGNVGDPPWDSSIPNPHR